MQETPVRFLGQEVPLEKGEATHSCIPGLLSDDKGSACNVGDLGSIPGSGRSPGGEHGNPPQYFCLENSMGRGAWQAIIRGVEKSWTQLK